MIHPDYRRNKNDKPESITKNKSITFSNFSCKRCFDENEITIGRDVEFKTGGVKMKVSLIRLNQATREFNLGFIQGELLENKVELTFSKEGLIEGHVKYSADKIKENKNELTLIGNAKLTIMSDELIEADEILITLY